LAVGFGVGVMMGSSAALAVLIADEAPPEKPV
jgi:hypothetical protein